MDPELTSQLQARPWWGNVRELRNAVEHASVIARGRPLNLSDFPSPQAGRRDRESESGAVTDSAAGTDSTVATGAAVESWTRIQLAATSEGPGDLYDRFLAATEPGLLRVVLQHTGGNRAAAAEILGMHRGTLRERLKKHSLDRADADE
jgi:two-component system nitrogen regulation response regulator GlnG